MNEVKLELSNNLHIRIVTEDRKYMIGIREYFTQHVEGFQFMPMWRSGSWDGKVCMINKATNTIPYGLLFDYIRIHKKYFKNYNLDISDEVKQLFKGPKFIPRYNLSLKPYPFQKECIRACLNYTKGIIRSATASGKSLIISYIIKTLLDRKNSGVNNAIIVVPNKQLVEQFYSDMIEYGIEEDNIGRVYQKYKQWDRPITISTWQTLRNNHDKLSLYDCIIVDECHGMKAHQLKTILKKSKARYRFGFTGTLHASVLDNWNTKSYIGPIIKEFPSGFLADKGFISKCNVNILNLEYQQKKIKGTYDEVKDIVFNNPFRMGLVKKLSEKLDHNVLLLVGKVEKEGEVLEEYLKLNTDKDVVFLSGRDDVDLREEWRKKMGESKNILMIATYGIFQQGLNIPNLKYIVLVAPFKSKIRILQSIGRSLRKHEDKEDGAYIFDIHDHTNFFDKHGKIRYRYYDSEKFEINEYVYFEGDDINLEELFN